jgi:HAMP domain-containing protein
MGLRLKFNLAMLVACAIGFAVAAFVLDRVLISGAREEVLQNARIMMTAANAIRTYTAEEIVPLAPAEHEGKFAPQTVPSYASQKNFKPIQAAFAGYSYREAALNPTNLVDRALDWEADIINAFRNDPVPERVIERDTPNGPIVYMARPIVVNDAACLTCHSTPGEAPAAMTKVYGLANGFGWKMNETIGAQILSVPMAVPLRLAQNAYRTFLLVVLAVLAVIVVALNVLLHYLVIVPVMRVSRMADAVSLGEEGVETYIKPGKDEISSLSVAFNRMRQSLDHAMGMLKA